MIITNELVFIHIPKTGGTFVTAMLGALYRSRRTLYEKLKAVIGADPLDGHPGVHKHAGCLEIPFAHRNKPIIGTVRNPYDRYVSQYEFAWWKTHPERMRQPEAIKNAFPSYPDLSFAEYIEVIHTFGHVKFEDYNNSNYPPHLAPGLQTKEFIRYFARDPLDAFARIDDAYIESRQWKDDLFDVHYLKMDSLNKGLYDFLVQIGFPPPDVEFILSQGKILPKGVGRTTEQKWEKYYTPELKQKVRAKEKLLFTLFPEFDV